MLAFGAQWGVENPDVEKQRGQSVATAGDMVGRSCTCKHCKQFDGEICEFEFHVALRSTGEIANVASTSKLSDWPSLLPVRRKRSDMAENIPPSTSTSKTNLPSSASNTTTDPTARGLPYYERLRRDLRDTLAKKRVLDKTIANLEENLYRHESAYLEETSSAGNIIKGFDAYIKAAAAPNSTAATGTISGAALGGVGARRKHTVAETDRVFSRSSVSWTEKMKETESGGSTPGGAGIGTPTGSGSFEKSTATTGKVDRKKKKGPKGDANADSEADSAAGSARPNKRLKVSYGRKED